MTVEQSVTVPELDLEAIRKRCEAATPGPWHFVPENAGLMLDHGYGLLYGEADSWGWEKDLYISVGCSGNVRTDLGQGAAEANAAFIAHARQDIPALLDHIARLSQPQDAPPVPDIGKRMAEAGHLAAELRLLAVEAKDREDGSAAHVLLQSAGFLDMIATALSARDALPVRDAAPADVREVAEAIFDRHFTTDRKSAPVYKNLTDDIATALSARDRLLAEAREALEQAAGWFQGYADGHRAKGDSEKAARNQERANACTSAYRRLDGGVK